jgi:hypothetical protein
MKYPWILGSRGFGVSKLALLTLTNHGNQAICFPICKKQLAVNETVHRGLQEAIDVDA